MVKHKNKNMYEIFEKQKFITENSEEVLYFYGKVICIRDTPDLH